MLPQERRDKRRRDQQYRRQQQLHAAALKRQAEEEELLRQKEAEDAAHNAKLAELADEYHRKLRAALVGDMRLLGHHVEQVFT